jgi:hypothetical protein
LREHTRIHGRAISVLSFFDFLCLFASLSVSAMAVTRLSLYSHLNYAAAADAAAAAGMVLIFCVRWRLLDMYLCLAHKKQT